MFTKSFKVFTDVHGARTVRSERYLQARYAAHSLWPVKTWHSGYSTVEWSAAAPLDSEMDSVFLCLGDGGGPHIFIPFVGIVFISLLWLLRLSSDMETVVSLSLILVSRLCNLWSSAFILFFFISPLLKKSWSAASCLFSPTIVASFYIFQSPVNKVDTLIHLLKGEKFYILRHSKVR